MHESGKLWASLSQLVIRMAETVQVEIGGKSKSEVAYEMARLILTSLEAKERYKDVTRKEYLRTVAQCVDALNGIAER